MQPGYTVELPPHGFVRYISHHGTDTTVVEAARVSYGEGSKGEEADRKLLHYLYKNRHTSPFEQCSITFNIRMPIFIMRQFVRHRMFRLNEFSARYKELPENFYLPGEWREQNKTGNKQGSTPSERTDAVEWQRTQFARAKHVYSVAMGAYKDMIADGVANEQARFVIPVACYTEIYVNCDLHNLTHFLRLRLDAHAQKEIRDMAEPMRAIAAELFPWTMEAFGKYKLKVVEEA